MKKIQLLSIMVISGAIAFGAQTAAVKKANVSFTESLARVESTGSIAKLVIDSDEAIHGLQFDISYNVSEITSIVPQDISGFEVQYNELSDGLIRGLVFSMQGNALPENLEFEFVNADNFNGTSTIEFKDIILADSNGKGVDVEAQSYVVNFGAAVNATPYKTDISDAYPNPFNPSTQINYSLENTGLVQIMVYDAAGRLVEELVNSQQPAGDNHRAVWDASNQASGVYFAKIIVGDLVETQKLMLLK